MYIYIKIDILSISNALFRGSKCFAIIPLENPLHFAKLKFSWEAFKQSNAMFGLLFLKIYLLAQYKIDYKGNVELGVLWSKWIQYTIYGHYWCDILLFGVYFWVTFFWYLGATPGFVLDGHSRQCWGDKESN